MRGSRAALGAVLFAAPLMGGARAQTVHIELEDATSHPAITGMHMRVDQTTVKAGRITLQAVNHSTALVHELLVLKTDRTGAELPYDAAKDAFVESRIKSLGEIEDLKPGRAETLTVTLRPGRYLLACNQPGHLHAGMWAKLLVGP
jgi:uncharacterized cupredoxin-like copper-binding protein